MLVTGATGFLGTNLVRRLLSDGVWVRVLARSAVRAKPLADRGAEVVIGDLTDRAAVSAALRDVAVVYHLAGRLLVPDVQPADYRRTHVDATKVLLGCCQTTPDIKRFVHCSTTGVLGVTGNHPADETAPFRPTNIYEATKAEAELAVRQTWRAGFPAVVARPGLVYGPGDLHLLGFFRSVLRRQFRPIGRRTVWLHPIYIDDLTEGLVRCGRRASAVGECFHLAGREPVPLAAFGAAVAQTAATRVPEGHIPLAAAQAAATFCDLLPAKLRRSAPLTRSRLDFLTHSRVYDVSKAERLLGFRAATDLPTGVARSVAWYREEGYLPAPRESPGRLVWSA